MSNNNSRNYAKMQASTTDYINSLHDTYSKVLAVRVDFGYSKEHGQIAQLADIKKDVKHMLDNRRGNAIFRHQIGYVFKFEDAPDKGPHVHALMLFDGQNVQKDAHRGDQLGDYWNKTITNGKGVYENCNRDKGKYSDCGIGMIDHSDVVKRNNLLNSVLPYMLKSEQSIDGICQSGKEKSITKGIAPKAKNGIGRPRSKKAE